MMEVAALREAIDFSSGESILLDKLHAHRHKGMPTHGHPLIQSWTWRNYGICS